MNADESKLLVGVHLRSSEARNVFFHSFSGGDRRGSDRGDGGTIMQNTYLQWVIENTATIWWHDSAEAAELDLGLARGAVGVTTNPYLANLALHKDRLLWAPAIQEVFAQIGRASCRERG